MTDQQKYDYVKKNCIEKSIYSAHEKITSESIFERCKQALMLNPQTKILTLYCSHALAVCLTAVGWIDDYKFAGGIEVQITQVNDYCPNEGDKTCIICCDRKPVVMMEEIKLLVEQPVTAEMVS